MASAELALGTKIDLGHSQHCRRVALWADEIAASLNVNSQERCSLRQAALGHHDPAPNIAPKPVLVSQGRSRTPGVCTSEEILDCFREPREKAPGRAADLAHVLELANTFDEQLEYLPFAEADLDSLLENADSDTGQDDWTVRYVLSRLQKIDRSDLQKIMPKLPPYPAVAMKVSQMLAKDDVSLRQLEQVAGADQVIAGKLVCLANSAFYSPFKAIRSLSQAIAYVGLEDAKKVLLAGGLQSVYSSPGMHAIWKHSLEAALTAEKIAKLSRRADPSEAFLLGLLHDVGKLAMTMLSPDVQTHLNRWAEAGCQPGVAEFVLCGFDHGEAGADILRFWEFAEEMAIAVQYHHRPERTNSAMAGILYLTEFWLDSNEDLPSNSRLAAAVKLSGVTIKMLEADNPRPTGSLLGL